MNLFTFGNNNTKDLSSNSDDGVVINAPSSTRDCECKSIRPKTCPWTVQHHCVCHTLGPMWCRLEDDYRILRLNTQYEYNEADHHCVCIDNPKMVGYCKAKKHGCVCHKTYKYKGPRGTTIKVKCLTTCRALMRDHRCSCKIDPKNCRYHIKTTADDVIDFIDHRSHKCICKKGINNGKCRSITHNVKCICMIFGSNKCIARPGTHSCVCDDVVFPYGECLFQGDHACRCEINPDECKRVIHKHRCLCYQRTGPYRCRCIQGDHVAEYEIYRMIRLIIWPLSDTERDIDLPIPPPPTIQVRADLGKKD
jgi:hypothetical protein